MQVLIGRFAPSLACLESLFHLPFVIVVGPGEDRSMGEWGGGGWGRAV